MLRNFRIKHLLPLLALFAISGGAAIADSPCAHLTLGLNPTSVARGARVKVTASVQNCSNELKTYAIHFNGKGPCDYKASIGNVYMTFPAGGTRSATLSFNVPAKACAGTATISARVYYDGALITSSSASLLVQ